MKQISVLITVLAAITLACRLSGTPPTAVVVEQVTIAPTVTATGQPTPTEQPAASPTLPPVPLPSATLTPTIPPTAAIEEEIPGAQVIEGPEIAYNGILFTLDPSFGSRVYVFDEVMQSPDGKAAHYTRFALSEESYCKSWCVQVYPVAQFHQAFGDFVFPPGGYGGGAAVIMQAQSHPLVFHNGEGKRALEMHGQMAFYASSESVSYHFRGYTEDGEYAVYIRMPVDAPLLASSSDPELNTNPNAIPIPTKPPDVGYPQEAILAYNQEMARQLDLLPPDHFDPELDLLDALVSSLRVEHTP